MARRLFVLMVLIVITFAILGNVFADDFVEGLNVNYTTTNGIGSSQMTQIAFQYVPTQTYDLSRIEFLLKGTADNVNIQLRQDNNGLVGSALSEGKFNSVGTTYTYQGANIVPYEVTGGQSYWIAIWDFKNIRAGVTSDADAQIVPFRYGNTGLNPDSYPILNTWYKPQAKFYGSSVTPEPASMLLFGVGGAVLAVFKRKKKH